MREGPMVCGQRALRASGNEDAVASGVLDTQAKSRAPIRRLAWIMSARMRLPRFLLVGGITALVQLGLLAALLDMRWNSLLGNAAALAVAMQVNFALSAVFTWADRWGEPLLGDGAAASAWRVALSRWGRFMVAAAVMVVLNDVGLDFAQQLLPALIAAAATSPVIAALNYLLIGRLVFRKARAGWDRPRKEACLCYTA